jgi:hypothetical protein
MTSGSGTILNHHLSQKFNLIGRCKVNYLINTLIVYSLASWALGLQLIMLI